MSINTFDAAWSRAATGTLGNSRMAQMYSSQSLTAGMLVPLTVGGYNTWTFANARSGHRLKFIYNGGVSGERGDQMIARLPTLLALKPGHMLMECFVNAPGAAATGYTTVVQAGWPSGWPALPNQGVAVTLTNVAAVEFSFVQYAIQRFLRMGGQIVTLMLDRCAENYTAAQIATGIEFNRLCKDTYEGDPRVNLIDDWAESHDPAASTTTTIRMKSGYMQESLGSGTHDSNKGAYYLSINRAAYIQANFPAPSFLPSDVTEIPSISLRNLLANPLFVTASGGTNGAGSTGTPPGSWTTVRSGGSGTQSVVVSAPSPFCTAWKRTRSRSVSGRSRFAHAGSSADQFLEEADVAAAAGFSVMISSCTWPMTG
jgi:hypothetical protein